MLSITPNDLPGALDSFAMYTFMRSRRWWYGVLSTVVIRVLAA